MLKTILINLLKLSLAGGLIAWLLSSGRLDLGLLSKLSDFKLNVLFAVALSVFNFLLVSFRWRSILDARSSSPIPLSGLMKITWIGQFFSSVLPGSVSGDLVKIMYVQKYNQSLSKKFLLASIFIDRLVGLAGLILLVGLTTLLFSNHILANAPATAPLLKINLLLATTVLLALIIFTFLHHWKRALLVKLQSMIFPQVLGKIITLWDDFVLIRHNILRAVLLSILIQFFGVMIFWSLILGPVGDQMDFVQALAFIPLGLMTLALPVAPSGLGVGHAIFQKLFEFSGIQNGASLFNLYFVVTLLLNLLGVVPYLMSKRTQEEEIKK
jgi:glycosyltransferase 2 family protein